MDMFWMVWSPQGGPPTFRHRTQADAEKEAERLFRSAPHSHFFVLQAVGMMQFAENPRPVEMIPCVDIPF